MAALNMRWGVLVLLLLIIVVQRLVLIVTHVG
jgi:hypothetical protein